MNTDWNQCENKELITSSPAIQFKLLNLKKKKKKQNRESPGGPDWKETGNPHLGKLDKVSTVERSKTPKHPSLHPKNSHIEMKHWQSANKYWSIRHAEFCQMPFCHDWFNEPHMKLGILYSICWILGRILKSIKVLVGMCHSVWEIYTVQLDVGWMRTDLLKCTLIKESYLTLLRTDWWTENVIK